MHRIKKAVTPDWQAIAPQSEPGSESAVPESPNLSPAPAPARPVPRWHLGHTTWRWIWNLLDLALFLAALALIAWVVGSLTHRGYLPANAVTGALERLSHWEGHTLLRGF